MHETRHEIIRIRDPPEPQKVWFYYSKTHILTNASDPLKVLQMRPKWTPKEPKERPKASAAPPKAPRKRPRKLSQKNELFGNLVSTMNGKRVQAWD